MVLHVLLFYCIHREYKFMNEKCKVFGPLLGPIGQFPNGLDGALFSGHCPLSEHYTPFYTFIMALAWGESLLTSSAFLAFTFKL